MSLQSWAFPGRCGACVRPDPPASHDRTGSCPESACHRRCAFPIVAPDVPHSRLSRHTLDSCPRPKVRRDSFSDSGSGVWYVAISRIELSPPWTRCSAPPWSRTRAPCRKRTLQTRRSEGSYSVIRRFGPRGAKPGGNQGHRTAPHSRKGSRSVRLRLPFPPLWYAGIRPRPAPARRRQCGSRTHSPTAGPRGSGCPRR